MAPSRKPGGGRFVLLLVLVALGLVLGGGALLSALTRAAIPGLPRASFTEAELAAAERALAERTRGFAPSGEEAALMAGLTELHLAETEVGPSAPPAAKLREQVTTFTASARALAAKDQARYLLLGDVLAAELDRTLRRVLERLGEVGKEEFFAGEGAMQTLAERAGGSFFSRALARGAILSDGRLAMARIAPQVMFRYRWRLTGGLGPEAGFSPTERKACLDFLAAFADPGAVDKRLEAVDRLAEVDRSYDAVIGRAVVLHEAGRDAEARDVIDRAIRSGDLGLDLIAFARALGAEK